MKLGEFAVGEQISSEEAQRRLSLEGAHYIYGLSKGRYVDNAILMNNEDCVMSRANDYHNLYDINSNGKKVM